MDRLFPEHDRGEPGFTSYAPEHLISRYLKAFPKKLCFKKIFTLMLISDNFNFYYKIGITSEHFDSVEVNRTA